MSTPEKLKMHSPDLVQSNIDRIGELFPNCVTEAAGEDGAVTRKIDFDLLRQELSDEIVEGPIERYHLNWPGKREAMLAANAPIAKTLRPCREESVDFDTTQNLFIEGDNLEALKLLQETYLGKVKMIYIDPPYNTGNDFVYHDDFSDSTSQYLTRSNQVGDNSGRLVANTEFNGRFHSDWLTMLLPRMKLARNLLADSGVIFVSIDMCEAANLRVLMDELFGAANFVTEIVWQKRVSPANDAKWFSTDHDSILVYARSKLAWRPNKLRRTESQLSNYRNPDEDPRGDWNSSTYTCNKSKDERPNLYYSIPNPNTGIDVWPKESAVWKYGPDVTLKNIEESRLYWGANGDAQFPRYKLFLSEVGGVVPRSVWSSDDAGHTQGATTELKALFGGADVFDSPKPVKLLSRLIEIGCDSDDDLVLDFFAGSGTTGHAALASPDSELSPRFILVQLPELVEREHYTTIAEITRERLRRCIQKQAENELAFGGNLGFRVLKIDSSNMKDVYYLPADTSQAMLGGLVDNIKSDRSGEDLLFQVLLDCGVDLGLPIKVETIEGCEVFFVNDSEHAAPDLVACFDAEVPDSLVKTIAAKSPLRAVFRDGCFATDTDKINVEQIFKQLSENTQLKSL